MSKALGMGKAMYHVALMSMEKEQVLELQQILDDFVWQGKKPWMNKKERYRPKVNGGLGCVHVQSMIDAMKAQWVIRIVHPDETHPVYLVAVEEIKECVEIEGLDLALVTDQRTKWSAAEGRSDTFTDLLSANNKIRWEQKAGDVLQREELWSRRLWRNPSLTGTPMWNRIAWKAGYLRVGDLVIEEEGRARWIRRQDVRKWINQDQVELAWKSLDLAMAAVKESMGDAPIDDRKWKKGDVLSSKEDPNKMMMIEEIRSFEDRQEGREPIRRLRGIVKRIHDHGDVIEDIEIDLDSSCVDKIATCCGTPIGVMERVPLNPERWRTKVLMTARGENWVEMPYATVRGLYQAILVGSGTVDDGDGIHTHMDWSKVWDPWVATKHQVWTFRYIHSRLFVGKQMAHAGAPVCVLGCGREKPDTEHYVRSCKQWGWLWQELQTKWRRLRVAAAADNRTAGVSAGVIGVKTDSERLKKIIYICISYALYKYVLRMHHEKLQAINRVDVNHMVRTAMETYLIMWDEPRMRRMASVLRVIM